METEEQSAVMAENASPELPAPESTGEENIKPARKAFCFSQLNLAIFYCIYLAVAFLVLLFIPDEHSEAVDYLAHYIPMYLVAFPLYLQST